MRSIVFSMLLLLLPRLSFAQASEGLALKAEELVQYQRAKMTGKNVSGFFKSYGLTRTHAVRYLKEGDLRQIWYYHVQADTSYQSTMPLYLLFKKKDAASIAVIDDISGRKPTQYVFWNKAYYLRLSRGLKRIGFKMSQLSSNVLAFRSKDTNIEVDITIWLNLYLMEMR